jgi:signal peptidase I
MVDIKEYWRSFVEYDKRRAIEQGMGLLLVVLSAVMMWKGLIAFSGSQTPIVVVLRYVCNCTMFHCGSSFLFSIRLLMHFLPWFALCLLRTCSLHLAPCSLLLVSVCTSTHSLPCVCPCDFLLLLTIYETTNSGSMEPAVFRGDILFLWKGNDPYRVGEAVVYTIEGRDIPIVHRILEVHEDEDTHEVRLLTKGDNNPVDDRGLYNTGQMWLKPQDILGRCRGYLPYVGQATIYLTDYPLLKYIFLGVMAIYALTQKDV